MGFICSVISVDGIGCLSSLVRWGYLVAAMVSWWATAAWLLAGANATSEEARQEEVQT